MGRHFVYVILFKGTRLKGTLVKGTKNKSNKISQDKQILHSPEDEVIRRSLERSPVHNMENG